MALKKDGALRKERNMKKFIMVIMVCVCMAGSYIPGYCQDDLGQSLDSEIDSEQSESNAETTEANTQFDAGEPMSL